MLWSPPSPPHGDRLAQIRKYWRGSAASTGTATSPVAVLVTVANGCQTGVAARFVAPSTT